MSLDKNPVDVKNDILEIPDKDYGGWKLVDSQLQTQITHVYMFPTSENPKVNLEEDLIEINDEQFTLVREEE